MRTLLITSAGPDEGKSTTAANLAVVMAQAEMKVILVDCDLRRPALHTIFNLRNTAGVTSLFLAGVEREDSAPPALPLQQTAVPNLWLLPSGPLPPNPAELLASSRMDGILARIEERADIVIIDSPPVVVVTDAAVLSTKVDGVLLVVGAGKVKRDVARKAKLQLEGVGARVLGIAVNNVPYDPSAFAEYYETTASA